MRVKAFTGVNRSSDDSNHESGRLMIGNTHSPSGEVSHGEPSWTVEQRTMEERLTMSLLTLRARTNVHLGRVIAWTVNSVMNLS